MLASANVNLPSVSVAFLRTRWWVTAAPRGVVPGEVHSLLVGLGGQPRGSCGLSIRLGQGCSSGGQRRGCCQDQ